MPLPEKLTDWLPLDNPGLFTSARDDFTLLVQLLRLWALRSGMTLLRMDGSLPFDPRVMAVFDRAVGEHGGSYLATNRQGDVRLAAEAVWPKGAVAQLRRARAPGGEEHDYDILWVCLDPELFDLVGDALGELRPVLNAERAERDRNTLGPGIPESTVTTEPILSEASIPTIWEVLNRA